MNKPGYTTTEFWLTAASLIAAICHALGFTGGAAGDALEAAARSQGSGPQATPANENPASTGRTPSTPQESS